MILDWLRSLFAGASLELDPASLAGFQREVERLAAATHRTVAEVMREETRALVKDLIASTPPFSRIAFMEDIDRQVYVGQAAIRRDVRRVFRPVSSLRAWRKPVNKRARRELERAVRKNDTAAVARILKLNETRVLPRAEPRLHQAARNERGVVPEGFRWFAVLDAQSIRDYEKELYLRVGKAKAGWETAARALGLSLPPWIERHTTPGRFEDRSKHPDEPGFVISNDVPYGDNFDDLKILEKSLARREQSMRARLEGGLGNLFANYN